MMVALQLFGSKAFAKHSHVVPTRNTGVYPSSPHRPAEFLLSPLTISHNDMAEDFSAGWQLTESDPGVFR